MQSIPAATAALAFAHALLALVIDAPPLRGFGRAGGTAQFGWRRCFEDQCSQTCACIFAVARLTAEALCGNDKYAGSRQPFSGQHNQAFTHRLGKTFGLQHIKAQFDRGGDFVDVLATGSRCQDEALGQLGFVNSDAARDSHIRLSIK